MTHGDEPPIKLTCSRSWAKTIPRVQEATPRALRDLVREAADRLRTRPEAGEWSVLECVGHIADAEIIYAGRYRWILVHDEPPLIGYDQDRWVAALHHAEADPQELLAVFEPLRAASIALWRGASKQDWRRIGRHEERGPESFDLSFRLIAGHDRFHLDQARPCARRGQGVGSLIGTAVAGAEGR